MAYGVSLTCHCGKPATSPTRYHCPGCFDRVSQLHRERRDAIASGEVCAPAGIAPIANCTPAERKPSAGWVELAGNYFLAAGDVFARANPKGWWWLYRGRWTPSEWQRTSHRAIRDCPTAPGIVTAQLAAEDALLAIAAEIVGAVRR